MNTSESAPLPAEFVARLTAHQGALYGFIVSLIGGLEHANDILQETNLKLCRKAAEYDLTQPFARWAYAFARNEVLSWRTRMARSRLVFDEALVMQITDLFAEVEEPEVRQLGALEKCVDHLPERQRELVEARYARGEALQDIAARMDMPENALAALFYRMRKALANCVTLSLTGQQPT